MLEGAPSLLLYRHDITTDRAGTVCDDRFDGLAADLICRQMGFHQAQTWTIAMDSGTTLFQESLPTSLDEVRCEETGDTFFSACSFDADDEDCSHDEDVLLQCTNSE